MLRLKQIASLFLILLIIMTLLVSCKQTPSPSSGSDESGLVSGDESNDISTPGSSATNGEVSGGDNSSTGVNSNPGSTQKTGNKTTGGAAQPDQAFIKSLKGTEIKIWTSQSEKPKRGTASGDRYYSILNKVASRYGAKITTAYDIDYTALQQSILSGKPLANVVGLQDNYLISWLKADTAASLNDAMAKASVSFNEPWYKQEIRKFMNLSGKQYGWSYAFYEPRFVFYNKRLVSSANLEDPYSVYERGDWNFAKLREYSKALTKTSADGSIITRGLSTTDNIDFYKNAIIYNGGDVVTFKNNKMSFTMDSKKSLNALDYADKMIKDGYLSYPEGTWNTSTIHFVEGKVAMLFSTKYTCALINDMGMTDAIGMVPFPYGPDAGKNKTIYYDQVFIDIIVKPSTSQAPKILYLMNQVYKELYAVREQDFYDDYRMIIRDSKAYELFKKCSLDSSNLKLSYCTLAGVANELYDYNYSISVGQTPAQAITALRDSFKNKLNENWGSIKFTGK